MKKILYILLVGLLISSCDQDSPSFGEIGAGTGVEVLSGSYANMLTLGNFLYVLGDGQLKTFNLDDPAKPEIISEQTVNFEIESLFISGENIFVGSQEAMFIYTIGSDGIPIFRSETTYNDFGEESCFSDPIAANSNYAYSTLENNSSGTFNGVCWRPGLEDQMRVYDIADLDNPVHVNTVFMNAPKGIALDGDILFVCEKEDGLTIFDVSAGSDPLELEHFPGFSAFDLIPANGLLMVIGSDTLHQFNYTDINNVFKIGSFELRD